MSTSNDYWYYDTTDGYLYYDQDADQFIDDATIIAKITDNSNPLTKDELSSLDIQFDSSTI